MRVWVDQNKLHLNDKTEILPTGSASGIDLPSSLHVGHSNNPFSSAARNLLVIFDSQLALKDQVNKLAYLEIRWIGPLQQYLSFEASKTCFLSRFDYCNALLEKFNEWSAQLLNLSTSLLYPLISTLTCFRVASGTASVTCFTSTLLAQPWILRSSMFPRMGRTLWVRYF